MVPKYTTISLHHKYPQNNYPKVTTDITEFFPYVPRMGLHYPIPRNHHAKLHTQYPTII